MKKYFVLALVVMAFVVAPVMADVAISGAYDYSAAWNTGDEEFAEAQDDLSLDFKAALDDYNTFSLKSDTFAQKDYTVTTDWGKYFGFAETGFGLTTTVGHWDPASLEVVDFTAYEKEDLMTDIEDDDSILVNMDIMGIVKPYFAMNFNTYEVAGTSGTDALFGAGIDFAPVAAEVYYELSSSEDAVDSVMGLGAMYSAEVADGVVANAGATFQMTKANADDWNKQYAVAAGVEAYGAVANVAVGGYLGDVYSGTTKAPNTYALSMLTLDANYAILEWLGVNGGMMMAMGDAVDDMYNGESFLGAEFGVAVSPGAVTYSLGYIVTAEEATTTDDEGKTVAAYESYTAYAVPANGGIYFAVDLSY